MPYAPPSWHDREHQRRLARGECGTVRRGRRRPRSARGRREGHLGTGGYVYPYPATFPYPATDVGVGTYVTGGSYVAPNQSWPMTITVTNPITITVNTQLWQQTAAANYDYNLELYRELANSFRTMGNVYTSGNSGPSVQVHGTSSPPSISVNEEIPGQLLNEAADPDAVLGEHYERLERRVFDLVTERAMNDTDGVWRGWVARVIDVRWDVERDVQTLAAVAWPTSRDATNDVWLGWQRDVPPLQGPVTRSPARRTAEELRRAREETQRRRLIQLNRARAITLRERLATRRAEALLRSVLDERQNRELDEHNGFTAVGSGGGRYWIGYGHSGNVYSLDERRARRESLCAHHYGTMPDYDHMLSQLLMLASDEAEFRRIANITPQSGTLIAPTLREAS